MNYALIKSANIVLFIYMCKFIRPPPHRADSKPTCNYVNIWTMRRVGLDEALEDVSEGLNKVSEITVHSKEMECPNGNH